VRRYQSFPVKGKRPGAVFAPCRSNTKKTDIHPRWVTVLAPQLKSQSGLSGTWRGTMRALDWQWQKFKSEVLKKFNGEELQSILQLELLSTAWTKD